MVFYNVNKPTRGHGFYETPEWLYKELDTEFNFDFDPCPTNPTFDGLSVEWGKSNFVNPPYKEIPKWVRKGVEEWKMGKTVVFLLPASTDTSWFHDFIRPNAEIRFLRGRVKFTGKPAPFPSIIVILRGRSL